jgi:hypothetical protein
MENPENNIGYKRHKTKTNKTKYTIHYVLYTTMRRPIAQIRYEPS